ncbi:MAG: hypothetical protein JNK78_09585 [Planctomycetes bacterium]|nr:hypothetical protein [Planctomycetota bacterium]
MITSRTTTALLLLTSGIAAQGTIEPGRGPFSTTGCVFSVPGASKDLLHYRADTGNVAPAQIIGPTLVDFRVASIFASVLLQDPGANIDVDALSLGNDVFPIAWRGGKPCLDPQRSPDGWAALLFSVTNASVSANVPDPMASRASGGGAGADLYSWILPGSALGEFANTIYLETGAEQLQVARSGEIDVLDVSLALLAQNGGETDPNFAPFRDRVFFSLTKASAASLAPLLGILPLSDVSGGTVFTSQWDGSAWGQITVYRPASALGLAGADPNTASDDIEMDALAVRLQTNEVVYSAVASAGLPQLLLQYWAPPFYKELLTDTGTPITTFIGDSDVDALCGIDPELLVCSRWLGTPYAPSTPGIILSGTQMLTPTGLSMLLHTNGADTGATGIAGTLFLQLAVNSGASDDMASLPWNTLFALGPWDATGTFACSVPIGFVLGIDVSLRTVLVQPSAMIPSTIVSTKL